MSPLNLPKYMYPGAVWMPLTGHSAPGTIEQRNTVVLHSTEGPTAQGAISTFKNSQPPPAGKGRVSAHFVIDRDGSVYQLLDLTETAWHASQANAHSVGIEHAAISAGGAVLLNAQHGVTTFHEMLATDEQYAASAALVKWLCGQLQISVDRAHVRTHNEASPRDGHIMCCTGALDPDKVVAMAAA